MLEVRDMHAYYGKSHILQGINLQVGEGEIVSLLGRNGVGRSTTCKAIIGEVEPQGSVVFKGQEIAGKKAFEVANLGVGYVPENRDIFPGLTTRQEGLSPQMTQKVADLLREIARRGVSTLLVEQKLSIAMDISDRVYVMGHGQVVFEGTPADLTERDDIRKEWLEV